MKEKEEIREKGFKISPNYKKMFRSPKRDCCKETSKQYENKIKERVLGKFDEIHIPTECWKLIEDLIRDDEKQRTIQECDKQKKQIFTKDVIDWIIDEIDSFRSGCHRYDAGKFKENDWNAEHLESFIVTAR